VTRGVTESEGLGASLQPAAERGTTLTPFAAQVTQRNGTYVHKLKIARSKENSILLSSGIHARPSLQEETRISQWRQFVRVQTLLPEINWTR
jgi:hypothetical protein